jgi:hypothetical protein
VQTELEELRRAEQTQREERQALEKAQISLSRDVEELHDRLSAAQQAPTRPPRVATP